MIRKDKYFPYKLLTPELLQRLRSVIIRNVRPSALEGGGEPGAAAVEETEPPAWQPPHQLALHDQSEVGPSLFMQENEGEELGAGLDGVELLLPADVVEYQGVALHIGTRQEESIYELLEVKILSVSVCHVHNLNLTFFIFCNPSILLALLLNTCLGI